MKEVHEICFWLNGDAKLERNLLKQACVDYDSSLYMKSCIVSGFFDIVRGGINASVAIEKCYLADSYNNIIQMVNPRVLKIKESTLTRTVMNCLI